jgi:hypothetical protein
MIFEQKERSRTDPKKPGEDEFAFYDSIAGAAYDAYRAKLNEWVAEYPDDVRAEAVARFRKAGSLGYQAALAELLVHATLRRQGYSVEIHPSCGHPSRRPDFLARDAANNAAAFVEVTSFGPAQELLSKSKRGAAVYNGIDQVKLPAGCRLGLDIIKHGANTPSLRKLKAAVEKWAAEQGEGEVGSPPSKTFTIDDWQMDVFIFSGFEKDVVPTRAIAASGGDMRRINPASEIREAAVIKGSAYDPLNAPYLLVVTDCKEELPGGRHNGEALLEAVLGTIYTEVKVSETGEQTVTERRKPDGYWGVVGAPAHTQVSAIALLPKPHLWDLRTERWQPQIVRNGSAERLLPAAFMPLPGFEVSAQGTVSQINGTLMADLVGLPAVWPPDEPPNPVAAPIEAQAEMGDVGSEQGPQPRISR